ncbi:sensor histidine kinase [Clostridium thailandense]|uniref:sensor histidine kinase n=1 Tax=Clostridium thailandense TaxID=2794346 RepID=UPI0039894CCB
MICLVDKYTNEKLKNKYKEEELSQLLDYTRNMENIMQEMRKNAHNHTNIMSTINGYLELNKIDELKQYFFEEINPEYNSLSLVNNNSASLKNLSNFPALKGILSYKLIISQQKELEIHIDIFENIAKIHMDTLDKCKILGILIDNAIEAAEDTDMKKVNIAVFKGENYVSFIIENSYKERPDIRKIFEKGYSTKGINRGLGLSMVRQIINDRYPNVLLNTLIKNDMFTQELHIYEKDT